jgi:hypothetical protein
VVSITPRPSFTPGERTPGSPWIRGWLAFVAGLDTDAKGKLFASAGDRTPTVQSVVRHCTDLAAPELIMLIRKVIIIVIIIIIIIIIYLLLCLAFLFFLLPTFKALAAAKVSIVFFRLRSRAVLRS